MLCWYWEYDNQNTFLTSRLHCALKMPILMPYCLVPQSVSLFGNWVFAELIKLSLLGWKKGSRVDEKAPLCVAPRLYSTLQRNSAHKGSVWRLGLTYLRKRVGEREGQCDWSRVGIANEDIRWSWREREFGLAIKIHLVHIGVPVWSFWQ